LMNGALSLSSFCVIGNIIAMPSDTQVIHKRRP
jgi:hypothetical protein